MKIGIFGGAFDPVHNGHLLLAEQCREQCELDEVWFVPTRVPPHKPDTLSPGRLRVEMLELATAGIPEFLVKRIELDRDEVSWTVDTLRGIRETNPDDELFLLIGADSLNDLRTWREPEAIADLATIVAVNRGGIVESKTDAVDASIRDRVRHVTMTGVALSATEIRDRVRTGHSIRFLVPRAVEQLVRERNLYAVQETPS
jgi:nicotinate-nucleotide adenylyltransferase